MSDFYRRSSCIALYSAVHNEVLTDTVFIRARAAGKTLTYPRTRNGRIEFIEVLDLADLSPGAFGVMEPQKGHVVEIEELSMVVVPGVAFDLVGHRLGYGSGFYDRALAECRADCVKVGFAYDSQLLAELPFAEHDQRLSVLMTESRTLNFSAC